MKSLLDDLNEQQQAAVSSTEGPVLVLAGPGSGKTRVLTYRIAYLVQQKDVPPFHILAVTFTNKAAGEMKERTAHLLNGALHGATIGTFHSICARWLRYEAEWIGLNPHYHIYDTTDQISAMRSALKDLNINEKSYTPKSLLAAVSRAKNEMLLPEELPNRNYRDEIVRRAYQRYAKILEANDALDFDDLLTRTVFMFRDDPAILQRYRQRYRYILVDEFQDTNSVQYHLIRQLAGDNGNIFVVGDEDQSIYRFRGADFRNVLRFRQDYSQARVFLLEENYRSTRTILEVANAIISHNKQRVQKKLHTQREVGPMVTVYNAYNETEEADYVCSKITSLLREEKYQLGDFAIMYRTNAQSRALEEAFVSRNMPYRLVGATRFYARKEIKDILAYLRIIHNPADEISLLRVINTPPRGLGEKSVSVLLEWARQCNMTIYDALQAWRQRPEQLPAAPSFPTRAKRLLLDFAEVWAAWVNLREQTSVPLLIDRVLSDIAYYDYLMKKNGDESRWENVQELRSVAIDTSVLEASEALTTFLENVSLVSDVDNLPEEEEVPTLLTLHMAKGLEFPVVFITGVEDGILPHSRSQESPDEMEEERRLFYVGVTRAKDRLYLLHTFRRTLWGQEQLSTPSRFLRHIPASLVNSGERKKKRRERTTAANTHLNQQEAQPSSWPKQNAVEPQFSPGEHVQHAVFGRGLVVNSALAGGDEEVTVVFDSVGIKKLLVSFAKLERIA